MKKTFKGCSFSDLWVSPADWKTTQSKSSLKKTWFVQCYFFDPNFSDKYPKGFPYRKKLNKLKTIEERRAAANFFLDEIPKLLNQGYNPITKKFMLDHSKPKLSNDINPDTPFIDALEFSKSRLSFEKSTNNDLKSVLENFTIGIKALGYDDLKIGEVRRKHIRFIIEKLEDLKGAFSDHKYNKYRTYLQILFKELVEFEAVEFNIINDLRKKSTVSKPREVLSNDERKLVNDHLKKNYPEFWRFTILFFHSGGRISELLRLQCKDVNLNDQYYLTLIKKGKRKAWVKRPIKDIAVGLWRKALFGGKETDFVFSRGLIPGENMIRREQINRRWRVHVKIKLGVTADFYALKHLNLDEVSSLLGVGDASIMAGHRDSSMVERVYAVGESERQMARLRKVGNEF